MRETKRYFSAQERESCDYCGWEIQPGALFYLGSCGRFDMLFDKPECVTSYKEEYEEPGLAVEERVMVYAKEQATRD
jgi:hypothetical protein